MKLLCDSMIPNCSPHTCQGGLCVLITGCVVCGPQLTVRSGPTRRLECGESTWGKSSRRQRLRKTPSHRSHPLRAVLLRGLDRTACGQSYSKPRPTGKGDTKSDWLPGSRRRSTGTSSWLLLSIGGLLGLTLLSRDDGWHTLARNGWTCAFYFTGSMQSACFFLVADIEGQRVYHPTV